MNTHRKAGWLRLSAATLLLSAALSSTAFADTGALRVKVTDSDGHPVAGATVSASTVESLTARSGETNANGEVRLVGLDPSADYVVSVAADGYQAQRNENVLVVSERTFNLPFILRSGGAALEEIVTYGRSDLRQLVDTTSALQSTDLTLDITESLPTLRTYQDYLQLAPSTKPVAPGGGNPSSKSGVNYQDIVDQNGNTAGTSSDNVYYVDGINVTDNRTGTFGANFNSEIIQEHQIITGGVPAEYEGGQGLISRVITKSGSNEFHGSVNYYAQSDSLVAGNDNLDDAKFSEFDTAFTFGGPIIKDKLWFFTSFQRKEREEDVIDPNTQSILRTVTREEDLGFAKLTWQPTENDKFIGEFFNDPTDRDGSFDTATLAIRDRAREQGGDNFKFEYSHAWDNVILTAAFMSHEAELSDIAADKSTKNDVAYTGVALPVSNVDTDKGGFGRDTIQFRDKEEILLKVEWFLDTSFGSHEIKAGYTRTANESFVNSVTTGDGAQYTSLGSANSGLTLNDYVGAGFAPPGGGEPQWTGERDIIREDYADILTAIQNSPDAAFFVGLLDSDSSGDVSEAELGVYVLDQTAGNPTGDVNVYRINQTIQGPTQFETEGDTFFIQDTWSINGHWTVTGGLRAERWEHFNSAGQHIFTFDTEIAPRLSVVYDLKGDGRSKVWGFFGRYYDPIRTNMTAFAGTVTGDFREEQIFLGDRWLTWRERGASGTPDGFFAPTTKTPLTNEFMIGYETTLTENQSIAITYTHRETKNILEDYNLDLYVDPDRCGDLCLGLDYFGFTEAPEANFFIATLAGAKREYDGVEVTWRKRRSGDSKWFALASYSFNDATGNSNSDSNADFQGDVLWLDPRAINATGDQPGNVEHLVKLIGSYRFDNGLELGATYLWNSGTLYSETFAAFGRHLPSRVTQDDVPVAQQVFDNSDPDNPVFLGYENQGVVQRWLKDNVIGSQSTPSFGTLNLRAKYVFEFGQGLTTEIFLDVFNVLDNQATRREQDLSGGDGVFAFGVANDWVLPRRFFVGARVSF
jgi:hypothetical protein